MSNDGQGPLVSFPFVDHVDELNTCPFLDVRHGHVRVLVTYGLFYNKTKSPGVKVLEEYTGIHFCIYMSLVITVHGK